MESTLSLSLNDLQTEVAFFLGWGRGPLNGDRAWTTVEQATITSLVKEGYAQFLHPPMIEGETTSYDWSFTKPLASLTLASGAQSLNLPDDFGGFEGKVTALTTSTTAQPWRIEWRPEDFIRQKYSFNPSITGWPQYVAETTVKGTTATAGTRSQLLVWPIADQAYTLQVRYYVNPDAISSAYPFPYGGAQHASTLKASCVAAAELYLDDMKGPRWQLFMERLQASVAMDRRNKPQILGYNADRSDEMMTPDQRHYWGPATTYNGSSLSL